MTRTWFNFSPSILLDRFATELAKVRKDLALVNVVKGPQGFKKEYFQKIKLTPTYIHPSYNCTKFQHDWTIFDCPEVLGNTDVKGDFQNIKKYPPGIHLFYKCAKFQHDWIIFDFPRLPRSFREKRVLRALKGRFAKIEK